MTDYKIREIVFWDEHSKIDKLKWRLSCLKLYLSIKPDGFDIIENQLLDIKRQIIKEERKEKIQKINK